MTAAQSRFLATLALRLPPSPSSPSSPSLPLPPSLSLSLPLSSLSLSLLSPTLPFSLSLFLSFTVSHSLSVSFFFFFLLSLYKDVNECLVNRHRCSVNAICKNLLGSHSCQCKQGFNGDGVSCTGKEQTSSPGTCRMFFKVYSSSWAILLALIEMSTNSESSDIPTRTAFPASTFPEV